MASKKKEHEDTTKKGPKWAKNRKNRMRRKASRQKKRTEASRLGVIILPRTEVERSPTPASLHDFGDPETP